MCKGALNTMRQMKNSGISWVGEIPQDWEIQRNKYIFKIKKDIVLPTKSYQLLSLTTNGIKEKDEDDTSGKVPENYDGYQIVRKHDLVMCLFDLDCSAVFSGLSYYDGMISPAYKILKIDNSVSDERYYAYWFNYVSSKRYYKQYSKSLRYTLNADEFNRLFSPVPPLEEQQCIADFLDRECERIDKLKADIQAQIDTLEQYKRSVITEAVTHGLNHDVFMKDSGAGWMPIVPQHWRVEKLKYNLCQRSVKNQTDKQVLSLYREYGIVPKDSRDDNHNVTSEDVSDYRYVRVGDFVVNKMKAWQGSVAVSNYEGIVSPAYYVYEFSNNSFNKKYFHYLIRNKTYTTEFRRLSGGIREGQWDLSSEALENILILIPPLDEQQAIAEYLDHKCAEMEQIISSKKAQLETLDDYKKSLIYEYVTGKKEVVL